MKLTTQALGALMMALQKSLLEQTDIVPVLLDFDFEVNDNGELFIKNAPTLDLSKSAEVDFGDLEVEEVEEV
jgi:hypothetical protein